MKRNKNQLGGAVLEVIVEIVLTLICFGVGAVFFSLIGVELDSPHLSDDVIILVGLILPFAVFGIIHALVEWIKGRIGR